MGLPCDSLFFFFTRCTEVPRGVRIGVQFTLANACIFSTLSQKDEALSFPLYGFILRMGLSMTLAQFIQIHVVCRHHAATFAVFAHISSVTFCSAQHQGQDVLHRPRRIQPEEQVQVEPLRYKAEQVCLLTCSCR
jgi:hypothetical protein